jgi:hypothetical protein
MSAGGIKAAAAATGGGMAASYAASMAGWYGGLIALGVLHMRWTITAVDLMVDVCCWLDRRST